MMRCRDCDTELRCSKETYKKRMGLCLKCYKVFVQAGWWAKILKL